MTRGPAENQIPNRQPITAWRWVGSIRSGGLSRSGMALPSDYPAFLTALNEHVLRAHATAVQAVNRELILLYWDIGRGIVENQQTTNCTITLCN
ncbi:MAG: hypothetical protein AAB676_14165 [Verrucomicrobiota bacterium]